MSVARKNILKAFLAALIVVSPLPSFSKDIKISSKPIISFRTDKPDQINFGKLEFISGLELQSKNDNFGGLSGLRLSKDGNKLFAISDQGHFLQAEINRTPDGKLTTLENAEFSRLRNRKGDRIKGKKNGDAESLEISGSQYIIGFERNHRIDFFNLSKNKLNADKRAKPISLKQFDLPYNKGPEATALSPLTKELFIFAEYALDKNNLHHGFIFKNNKFQPISVSLTPGYSLTDAHFMENGDLLILERFYTPFTGSAMRIRKFARENLKANAVLNGEIIIEATSQMEIDNMEGLAISKLPDGSARITLISDDNFSKNQRTILLEFKLAN